MPKPHALGILVKDRWDLTKQTLESIYYSDQPKQTYDLFVIDNGSSEETAANLKRYTSSGLGHVKTLIRIPESSIPAAWNLFLMLTADYQYRTKIDNDIILSGTSVQETPKPHPIEQLGPFAGAPRSVSVVRSLGQISQRTSNVFGTKEAKFHSAFLQHMEEFGLENSVDLVALVSISPPADFSKMFNLVNIRKFKNRPYLESGCIQISEAAFRKLGYLDESMQSGSFQEYSQRALLSQLNIGYHPYYGTSHLGYSRPTKKLNFIESQLPLDCGFVSSEWLKHEDAIKSMCEKHAIVSIR